MQNTNPYYHTTYVMAFRRDAASRRRSGWTTRGCATLAPRRDRAHAAGRTCWCATASSSNTRFYRLIVDTRIEAPGADLMRAVAEGELDAALVWGPIAGYQAKVKDLPLIAPRPADASRARRAWISASPWACAGRSRNGAAASTR